MGAKAALGSSSSWSTITKAPFPSCVVTRLYPKSKSFTGKHACQTTALDKYPMCDPCPGASLCEYAMPMVPSCYEHVQTQQPGLEQVVMQCFFRLIVNKHAGSHSLLSWCSMKQLLPLGRNTEASPMAVQVPLKALLQCMI